MSQSSTLKTLLKEYETKKLSAEIAAEKRKQELYASQKRLQKIDETLNHSAFTQIKEILNQTPTNVDFAAQVEDLKKEKESILSSLQLSKDYLEPQYECKICQDTGYVTENYKTTLCNCIKQKIFDIEYNKANIGNLEKENFSHFRLERFSNEKNPDKYKSPLSPRENMVNIKKICKTFIQSFDDENEKNLLFTGNTGLGKTFLSNCIANELLAQGKTVLYQTSSVMLDTIIDYRFGKADISKDIYDNILNVDLLIIDDLGTETMNSLKFTELFNIINTRLLNQNSHITKTIISTNLTLQNLFATYDERIVSRLVGYYNICRFFGDDLRFQKSN